MSTFKLYHTLKESYHSQALLSVESSCFIDIFVGTRSFLRFPLSDCILRILLIRSFHFTIDLLLLSVLRANVTNVMNEGCEREFDLEFGRQVPIYTESKVA